MPAKQTNATEGNGNGKLTATERRAQRIARRQEKMSQKVTTVPPDELFERAVSEVGKVTRTMVKSVQRWNFGEIDAHMELVSELSTQNRRLHQALQDLSNAYKILAEK